MMMDSASLVGQYLFIVLLLASPLLIGWLGSFLGKINLSLLRFYVGSVLVMYIAWLSCGPEYTSWRGDHTDCINRLVLAILSLPVAIATVVWTRAVDGRRESRPKEDLLSVFRWLQSWALAAVILGGLYLSADLLANPVYRGHRFSVWYSWVFDPDQRHRADLVDVLLRASDSWNYSVHMRAVEGFGELRRDDRRIVDRLREILRGETSHYGPEYRSRERALVSLLRIGAKGEEVIKESFEEGYAPMGKAEFAVFVKYLRSNGVVP